MILLDTHVWWWALNEPKKLSNKAYKIISENPPNQRAIASIAMWEFAMMVSTGKVEIKIPPDQWLDNAVNKTGLEAYDLNPKGSPKNNFTEFTPRFGSDLDISIESR